MRKLLALGAVFALTAGTAFAFDLQFTIGNPQTLGVVGGIDDSYSMGVNSRGTVVGYGVTTDPFTFEMVYTPLRSVNGGAPVPLAIPAGWRFVTPTDVSENDITVGYGAKPASCFGCMEFSAVIWDANGNFIPLGPYYDPVRQSTSSNAQAISASGRYAAGVAVFEDNVSHATRWDGTTPEALSSPCTGCEVRAVTGVNDAGDVVGATRDVSGAERPVVWRNGSAQLLSMPAGLVPDQFSTTGRMRITNSGEVYGSLSFVDADGNRSWYALRWDASGTPSVISTLPSTAENTAAVGASGLVALRTCEPDCQYQLYFGGVMSPVWLGGSAFYGAASATTGDASSSQAYLAGSYWNGSHDQMMRAAVSISGSEPPPPPNKAPVVSLPSAVTGPEGAVLTVLGAVTDDDGPGPYTYQWDLDGDGTFEKTTPASDLELTPADNGTFVVSFRAVDGAGAQSGVAQTTVTVTNVAPTVQPGSDITTGSDRSARLDAHFGDPGADRSWSYVVSWGDGTPDATGTLDASDATIAPAHTYGKKGVYEVSISVTDKDGSVGVGSLHVTVPNRAPAPHVGGPYSGVEGSGIEFDGSSSSDADGDGLTYSWDFGDGTSATGASPGHTYVDNGAYVAKLTVTDTDGASTTAAVQVMIGNLPPVLGVVSGLPEEPIMAGTPVTLTASFTDPGRVDTHSGSVQWDSALGYTTNGVTTEAGSVRATSSTLAPGVYTVSLRVVDKDGGEAVSSIAPDYVVVYDPVAGFVTGGGWIWSPSGACRLTSVCTGVQGRATFGFVSRYQKGTTAPSGNTEFTFQAGGLRFSSTSYEWLVVSGWKAQYKGEGKINGTSGYCFMLTAVDGDLDSNGKSADRFRIKIWNCESGAIAYDNQMGQSDNSSAATMLSGGSIQIHK